MQVEAPGHTGVPMQKEAFTSRGIFPLSLRKQSQPRVRGASRWEVPEKNPGNKVSTIRNWETARLIFSTVSSPALLLMSLFSVRCHRFWCFLVVNTASHLATLCGKAGTCCNSTVWLAPGGWPTLLWAYEVEGLGDSTSNKAVYQVRGSKFKILGPLWQHLEQSSCAGCLSSFSLLLKLKVKVSLLGAVYKVTF